MYFCDMKKNTIVVFDKNSVSKSIYNKYYKDIFHNKDFLYLGDVSNMNGHCFLVDLETGLVVGAYHTENFKPKQM